MSANSVLPVPNTIDVGYIQWIQALPKGVLRYQRPTLPLDGAGPAEGSVNRDADSTLMCPAYQSLWRWSACVCVHFHCGAPLPFRAIRHELSMASAEEREIIVLQNYRLTMARFRDAHGAPVSCFTPMNRALKCD